MWVACRAGTPRLVPAIARGEGRRFFVLTMRSWVVRRAGVPISAVRGLLRRASPLPLRDVTGSVLREAAVRDGASTAKRAGGSAGRGCRERGDWREARRELGGWAGDEGTNASAALPREESDCDARSLRLAARPADLGGLWAGSAVNPLAPAALGVAVAPRPAAEVTAARLGAVGAEGVERPRAAIAAEPGKLHGRWGPPAPLVRLRSPGRARGAGWGRSGEVEPEPSPPDVVGVFALLV
jgi:hypothetical protein